MVSGKRCLRAVIQYSIPEALVKETNRGSLASEMLEGWCVMSPGFSVSRAFAARDNVD